MTLAPDGFGPNLKNIYMIKSLGGLTQKSLATAKRWDHFDGFLSNNKVSGVTAGKLEVLRNKA